MGVTEIITLIVNVGVPAAEKLWQIWFSGKDITQADWDALKLLTEKTPRQYLIEAMSRNNINSLTPEAQAIMRLVDEAAKLK